MKNAFRKSALAAAVVTSLGASTSASAVTLEMSWSGLITLLDKTGAPLSNTSAPYYYDPTWGYGLRTQISGTIHYDTTTNTGTGTIAPFHFLSELYGYPFTPHGLTFQNIGNGTCTNNDPAQGCQPGNLLLGNMLIDWTGNFNIPLSIVWDAAGLFSALSDGFSATDTITGVGAIPASNGIKSGNYPIGSTPIATTTWNTTALCTVTVPDQPPSGGGCLTVNPSGGLPLIADTIGGSPMIDGPFDTYNMNLDITSLHIDSIIIDTVVPIPAAFWLFGSGLLGLAGIATRHRRKR